MAPTAPLCASNLPRFKHLLRSFLDGYSLGFALRLAVLLTVVWISKANGFQRQTERKRVC